MEKCHASTENFWPIIQGQTSASPNCVVYLLLSSACTRRFLKMLANYQLLLWYTLYTSTTAFLFIHFSIYTFLLLTISPNFLLVVYLYSLYTSLRIIYLYATSKCVFSHFLYKCSILHFLFLGNIRTVSTALSAKHSRHFTLSVAFLVFLTSTFQPSANLSYFFPFWYNIQYNLP